MRLLGTVPERRCSSPLALTLPSPRSSGSGPASDGSGSGLSSGPSNASPLPSNNQEEEEESQSPAAPQFSQLRNLSALFEQGFLLESEYQQRRSQLIDELTGTRGETLRRRRSRVSSSVVLPKGPPDFALIPAEAAVKHTFDLVTRAWQTTSTVVRLDDAPFARGGLRLVYHMREQDPTAASAAPAAMGEVAAAAAAETTPTTVTFTSSSASSLVAKMAIDRSEDLQTYFRDVEMQAHCAHYARLFNSYEPPRAVQFCTAWILELPEREGSPLCAVEVYCPGEYRKHNNNYGYVSDDERNTPQAFSHFTYIASKRSMLVVDIQGVGDLYTDPQVHTVAGTDFGKGNLGVKGFDRFLSTHRCNAICRYLKLPPVNPKPAAEGTLPSLPVMPATKISRRSFKEHHYFDKTPSLAKFTTNTRDKREIITTTTADADTDADADENDSFLRFWSTRSRAGGADTGTDDDTFSDMAGADSVCSFAACALL